MFTRLPLRRKIYILLLVIVMSLPILIYWIATDRTKLRPLTMPVILTIGSLNSPNFVVSADGEYLLYIDADRKIDFHKLNCLMGIETLYPERCKNVAEVIDIDWAIFSGKQLVSKGSSHNIKDGFWGATVSRCIGKFKGEKGHLYIIQMSINKAGGYLNEANLKLRVEVHPSFYEKRGFIYYPLIYFYFLICLVGLFIIGVRIITRRQNKSDKTTQGGIGVKSHL